MGRKVEGTLRLTHPECEQRGQWNGKLEYGQQDPSHASGEIRKMHRSNKYLETGLVTVEENSRESRAKY